MPDENASSSPQMFNIRNNSSRIIFTRLNSDGMMNSRSNNSPSGLSFQVNLCNAIREQMRNYLPRNSSQHEVRYEPSHPARVAEEYFDRHSVITTSYPRPARPQADTNVSVVNPIPQVEEMIGNGQRGDVNGAGSENPINNNPRHENHLPSEAMNSGSNAANSVNSNNESNERSDDGRSTAPSNAQPSSPLSLRTVTVSEVLRQSPETRAFLELVFKYLPFVLILLIKGIYDHRVGILVLSGMLMAFSYGNLMVKREAGKQSRRSVRNLYFVFFNLLVCIFSIYYIFQDQRMHLGLFLIPPYSQPLAMSDLFWLVCVTDFVLKMITVILKGCLVALPASLIAYQKRGKWFHFIETTSQAYRSLCPIQPWLYFLMEAYQGSGKVFGVLLCAAYAVSKVNELVSKVKAWRAALTMVMQDLEVGVRPSAEQLMKAGDQCPICQDSFTSPILLSQGCGRHIFCEACILHWLDRERSCPLCRAKVPTTNHSRRSQRPRDVELGPEEEEDQDEVMPMWRDGHTTHVIQFY
ncbi:RING finger and transmembrane domain-containing protein 2 [Ischnura elegans]|uniref:RING finger and transmembrane domain-containing protein 2 n=1 Tax=Ischnura elegans TaxID=197161 RepID=UPI001ED895E0|nr:RING finger and transmembrane domain-containing protein 2 [Ischnura elegans]